MIKPRRIDQITPHLSAKDAIGNHILTLKRLLEAQGFISEVFAEGGESGLPWRSIDQYPNFDHEHNIVIHHYSTGSTLPDRLMRYKAFRVTYYHNITPPSFFLDPDELSSFITCLNGYQQMPVVNLVSDYVWAVSDYNAEALHEHGFKPARILPIIRDYEALTKLPSDPRVSSILSDEKKTILFVGRVLPHKGQHDLILLAQQYKKYIDPNIRVVLIGGHSPGYVAKLKEICRILGLTYSLDLNQDADIILPGKTTDEAMATVYRKAHAFVCLSDHEGFCVPLVEAMFFGLPIIAHKAAAVPHTVAHGGLVVDKENILDLMSGLKTMLTNDLAREFWSQRSLERSRDFQLQRLESQFNDLFVDLQNAFNQNRLFSLGEGRA